ncbi:unnamed protein product [Pedinophyceae sp. YPF-701]|nr:unnamed protein product [Pedinophyceae sp. YPF-701]
MSAVCHTCTSPASSRSAHVAAPDWARTPYVASTGPSTEVLLPEGRIKGAVHFIGGAFAGASPALFYQQLLRHLRDAGYVVVTTPYALTFRHADCARALSDAFAAALADLDLPPGAPVFALGHSGGSLLHLLIGAKDGLPPPFETDAPSADEAPDAAPAAPPRPPAPAYRASVLVSTNNFPVSEAIPIPGLLDNLPDAVKSLESSFGAMQTVDLVGLARQAARASPLAAFGAAPPVDEGLLGDLEPAVNQVPSVLREVRDGLTDFFPTPAESREIVRSSLQARKTLLVKFSDDNTDESEEMYDIIRASPSPNVELLRLSGTHVTPNAPSLWMPFGSAGPVADEAARLAHMLNTRDTSRLAGYVLDFFADNS